MKMGFALEYSLGHVTHAENLKKVVAARRDIEPTYVDLPFDGITAPWAQLPVIRGNWSVRASLGAYLGLRERSRGLDSLLFHTQVTSLFSAGLMRRTPSTISLDATPLQYDSLGAFYGHVPSQNQRLEAIKKRLNQRAFHTARQLVTWSEWTRQSLIHDYGVPASKIVVIPPGIDTEAWRFSDEGRTGTGPLRLLFVGGDFQRKGGDTMLDGLRPLLETGRVHLDIATKTPGVAEAVPNVTVHYGLVPNSNALRALFASAQAFVFPTRGDCLPLAVMEALTAGLPVVTTNVGALSEAVTDGANGFVVPPNDPKALRDAVERLVEDPALRGILAANARDVGCARFSGATNYQKLIETIAHAH